MKGMRVTCLIVVLRSLVLHEELETLFPNNWLDVTAAPMALFWLLVATFRIFPLLILTLFLRVISLADHFGFAVGPYNGHALLGIPYVTNFFCKIRIRLYVMP